MREKVGQVNETEKNEILRLYEKILALKEVSQTINNVEVDKERKERLVNKINTELPIVEKLYNDWWHCKTNNYLWKKDKDGKWSINFSNNTIYFEVAD